MEKSEHVAVTRCCDAAYVRDHRGEFGGKTVAIALLLEAGYRVPKFVAIPEALVSLLAEASTDDSTLATLVGHVIESLASVSYAVRSSAFVEDGALASHAGEFMTVLDCAPNDLGAAILSVIHDAKAKGQATPEHPFSMIIQEYIHADHSGVIFTRNPIGGRESVIEWREGRGAEVVGGSAVQRAYVNDDARAVAPRFPGMSELIVVARTIERFFDVPQDIEWAVRGGTLFILQSRPITTVSQDAFRADKIIDELFQKKSIYYLSRADVGESFASCTPLGLDVLKFLYRRDGPIAKAYHALHIAVELQNNFTLVRGTLYVDQECELRQFFHAYGYAVTDTGMVPRVVRFVGLWQTLLNSYRFAHLPLVAPTDMREKIGALAQKIENAVVSPLWTVENILALLDETYREVFTVNLFAADVFRRAELAIAAEPFPLTTLLLLSCVKDHGVRANLFSSALQKVTRGNSVNIADTEPFFTGGMHVVPQEELQAWWDELPKSEQTRIATLVTTASEYQSLREEGRIITVMLISQLRMALRTSFSGDEKTMFFATLAELLGGTIADGELEERRMSHEREVLSCMPTVIASIPPVGGQKALGVSPGRATGTIVDIGEQFPQDAILFTDRLSPDIAPYLSSLRGVIATEGGLLSHMAIVAREAGIPVVIDPQARERIASGMRVSIDGGDGSIVVLRQ